MIHNEFKWKTEDGLELFGQSWAPDNRVKSVICLVHGMGEHSGRYNNLISYFVSKEYAVISYDQRGHGRSGGLRGHTPSYEFLISGITDLISEAGKRFAGRPLFLYGHSMGGNLVLNYALGKCSGLAGVIASAPWLKLKNPPGIFLHLFARVMNRILPTYTTHNGLRSSDLSNSEKKDSVKDELNHPWISVRTFLCIEKAGRYAIENAANVNCPVLILHGSDDNVTSPDASCRFALNSGNKCTLKIWSGLAHEIHNEPENTRVFDEISAWMNAILQICISN